MKHLLALSLIALALGCSSEQKAPETAPAVAAPTLPTTVEAAVASGYRTEANKARDVYRHPVETLNFFGIKPDMTVVEVAPGGGWYLEILAPFLASQGHYIAAQPAADPNAEESANSKKIADWEKAHPDVGSKIMMADFNPPDKVEVAPDGTADMVLTFRNVHNWMANGAEKAAFKAFFKALKPGGVLGVVEHRADAKQKRDKKAKSGYVREQDIVDLAKSVGFKLDNKSEINNNPKDMKSYPEGVWTLPPVLRLGDKDREKYVAVGESDRMTLRFVKPEGKKKKKSKK